MRAMLVFTVTAVCKKGEWEYSGFCYTFHDETLSYEEAQKSCSTEGGELVSIGDQHEQAFINSE